MTTPPEALREVADGVFLIDVFHPNPGHTCCYLIRHNDGAALIDCGGKRGVSAVMAALKKCGLPPEAVEWLVPTHVHLDHSGGAGDLMRLLPRATLAAHASTIKHLVSPHAALTPAARALFGDGFFDEHYGEVAPVDKARTRALNDGDEILVGGGRALLCVYSPGHAWNHFSVYDRAASFFIAGDAYGVSYREMDAGGAHIIVPVMPPSQFHPETMTATIRKLRALNAASVGLAHFGVISDGDSLAAQQLTALSDWTETAQAFYEEDAGAVRQRMYDYILAWSVSRAAAAGVAKDKALHRHKNDAHLSSSGFAHWLAKNRQASTEETGY